jgi:hypothetical protein
LTTKVLKDNGFGQLGYYSLAVSFMLFGMFSFLSAPIVRKLGSRISLSVGSFCFGLRICSFLLPIYFAGMSEEERPAHLKVAVYVT